MKGSMDVVRSGSTHLCYLLPVLFAHHLQLIFPIMIFWNGISSYIHEPLDDHPQSAPMNTLIACRYVSGIRIYIAEDCEIKREGGGVKGGGYQNPLRLTWSFEMGVNNSIQAFYTTFPLPPSSPNRCNFNNNPQSRKTGYDTGQYVN